VMDPVTDPVLEILSRKSVLFRNFQGFSSQWFKFQERFSFAELNTIHKGVCRLATTTRKYIAITAVFWDTFSQMC